MENILLNHLPHSHPQIVTVNYVLEERILKCNRKN
nr:MAG TPA: hypothetical protein [Bacteriophage sp.]